MADWSLDVSAAFRVAADLTKAGPAMLAKARGVTRHYAQLVKTQVQANASGRPGPRAVTGDYRRSIAFRSYYEPGGVSADVGTNKPQGRRLEFGFVGADSRGRVFDQAPLPHFGPALDKYADPYAEAIANLVDGI